MNYCIKYATIRVSVTDLYGKIRASENPYSRMFYAEDKLKILSGFLEIVVTAVF